MSRTPPSRRGYAAATLAAHPFALAASSSTLHPRLRLAPYSSDPPPLPLSSQCAPEISPAVLDTHPPPPRTQARLLLDQLEQLASRSSTGSLLRRRGRRTSARDQARMPEVSASLLRRRLSGHLGSSLMSSLGNSIASSDGSKSGGDDAHPPPHGGAATSPARRRKLPPRTEPAQRQSCPAGPARAAPRRQSCPDSGGRQDVEVV